MSLTVNLSLYGVTVLLMEILTLQGVCFIEILEGQTITSLSLHLVNSSVCNTSVLNVSFKKLWLST